MIGFTKTQGVIRTLTIGEQLKQIVTSRTDGRKQQMVN